MGTNYYAYDLLGNRLHIGKSSAGWTFALRVHPELGINDLKDWERHFARNPGCVIMNEYHDEISDSEMMDIITRRAWLRNDESIYGTTWEDDMGPNAEHGPNGLWRCTVDGVHCIGHGSGTWDLIDGEFS